MTTKQNHAIKIAAGAVSVAVIVVLLVLGRIDADHASTLITIALGVLSGAVGLQSGLAQIGAGIAQAPTPVPAVAPVAPPAVVDLRGAS